MRLAAAGLAALLLPGPASGQQAEPNGCCQPGARVRIELAGATVDRREGQVMTATGDTIVILHTPRLSRRDLGDPFALAIAKRDVRTIQVSHRAPAGPYVTIGAAIGFVGGYALGSRSVGDAEGYVNGNALGLVTGLGTGAIGALVGFLAAPERWVTVPIW